MNPMPIVERFKIIWVPSLLLKCLGMQGVMVIHFIGICMITALESPANAADHWRYTAHFRYKPDTTQTRSAEHIAETGNLDEPHAHRMVVSVPTLLDGHRAYHEFSIHVDDLKRLKKVEHVDSSDPKQRIIDFLNFTSKRDNLHDDWGYPAEMPDPQRSFSDNILIHYDGFFVPEHQVGAIDSFFDDRIIRPDLKAALLDINTHRTKTIDSLVAFTSFLQNTQWVSEGRHPRRMKGLTKREILYFEKWIKTHQQRINDTPISAILSTGMSQWTTEVHDPRTKLLQLFDFIEGHHEGYGDWIGVDVETWVRERLRHNTTSAARAIFRLLDHRNNSSVEHINDTMLDTLSRDVLTALQPLLIEHDGLHHMIDRYFRPPTQWGDELLTRPAILSRHMREVLNSQTISNLSGPTSSADWKTLMQQLPHLSIPIDAHIAKLVHEQSDEDLEHIVYNIVSAMAPANKAFASFDPD